ncbi:MAG: signal peptidase II [Chitinispirillales bacterium]|jgi:signal peptidase II|nr:signal peptidase II [Chitinispirillales bacterium]
MKHRWIFLIVITAAGFAVDFVTKQLAHVNLTPGVPRQVIGDYFQLLLVYNKGALFGINPADWIPGLPVNLFFLIFITCAVGFLLLYYKSLKKNEILMHWGLALVLPGAFGNMFDRIARPDNGVVDFIRMGIPPDTYWYIYNVADIYVTVGVAIMMLSFLREGKNNSVRLAAVQNTDSSELTAQNLENVESKTE